MTKIDVISGFYGAGKTTFIKKIMKDAVENKDIVYIKCSTVGGVFDSLSMEREGFRSFEIKVGPGMKNMSQVLTGVLEDVFELLIPSRIVIENAGNMGTKQLLEALEPILLVGQIEMNIVATILDAKRTVENVKVFPHLFREHIENAQTVILRGREELTDEELYACEMSIRGFNNHATVLVETWCELESSDFLGAVEVTAQLQSIVRKVTKVENMVLVYDAKNSVDEKVLAEERQLTGLRMRISKKHTLESAKAYVDQLINLSQGLIWVKAHFLSDTKQIIRLNYLQGEFDISMEDYQAIGDLEMFGTNLDMDQIISEMM